MKQKVSVPFMLLGILFNVCLIAANLLETKVIQVFGITVTAGLLVFPISYIINDCIAEVWGFRKARLIIWSGFAMNFFVVMLGLIAVALPAAPFWDGAAHFNFEKLRQEKYDLNEDEIKPHASLEDVRSGLYTVANKLYGITLTELNDVPVYEPDVKVYEVKDADGSFLGLFYADYFPRAGKRGGAWMSNFREQAGEVRPLIYNVASFTKPAGNMPSLLTLDEVETMFHEFGHALHGMLTKCNYKGVSGTSVAQDFVELPSQIMEHWAVEPEVLKLYAKHYETREVIPDELITKIQNQGTFNQGFMTTELLAAALLDMELHNLTDTDNLNVVAFEKETMDKLGLIPEIAPRYRATYFSHIIGGYAAGYYSYLWAEVLDTDAFEAFKEHGVFDKNTADSFRKNILEKGGTEDPMTLYRGFRGADPSLEPLLKNRGLK